MASIVLWQNIPSIHQAPLVRELARQWAGPVLLVVEEGLSQHRHKQGWQQPDFGNAELIIRPSRQHRHEIISNAGENSIHLFSGIRAYPETYWSLKQVACTNASLAIYAEHVDDRGLRGPIKRLQYSFDALRWGSRVDLMLITGQRGREWFAQRGFPVKNIAPFAYFPEPVCLDASAFPLTLKQSVDQINLLFLAELIPRKGVDILLISLSGLQDYPWLLRIAGIGSHGLVYQQLAEQLGIADRLEWLGSLPNHQVPALMAESDCLILPSRFDGWGAVVNEALLAGTPALVSDACGASELVESSDRGLVFAADSQAALTQALADQFHKGPNSSVHRLAIQAWAHHSISPAVAAQYLLDQFEIVNLPDQPLCRAPWLI